MFCGGLGLIGTWLYFALLESSEWQGTAGKKVLGLIVTDMAGSQGYVPARDRRAILQST